MGSDTRFWGPPTVEEIASSRAERATGGKHNEEYNRTYNELLINMKNGCLIKDDEYYYLYINYREIRLTFDELKTIKNILGKENI